MTVIPTPPEFIDGARVLEWAWSGPSPFGVVPGCAEGPIEIYGLALATCDGILIYRFSCDQSWSCIQDGLYDSVEEAKRQLPLQYCEVQPSWRPCIS